MNDTTHNLVESRWGALKIRSWMRRLFALILAGAAIPSLGSVGAICRMADDRDTAAIRVVEQFMAAAVAKDLDSVMQVVAVPFFLDARKNITTMDDLREEIRLAFALGASKKIKYSIGKVQAVSDAIAASGDQKPMSGRIGALIAEVLVGDDRLVEVTLNSPPTQTAIVMVSFRDGNVRVAGYRD